VLGQTGALHPAPVPGVVAQVSSVSQVPAAPVAAPQVAPAPVGPANDEAAPTARDEHAVSAEPVRKKDAAPRPEAAAVATAAAPAPKALKPALVTQPPRRAPRSEQVFEVKPHAPEALPVLPSKTVDSGPRIAAPAMPPPPSAAADFARDPSAPAPGGESDRPLFARLKLVPSWFSPANDRPIANDKPIDRPVADVPRPPMPVGEPMRNLM